MVEKSVEITNPSGLHARLAALFVQAAGKFTSKIWISEGDRKVSAKSIMGIMSLSASTGTSIIIGADGDDEQLAIKELSELVRSGFKES